MALSPFLQLLARGTPVLLDGGLATELEAQGHDIGTTLWSAELLRSNPRAVVRAHRRSISDGTPLADMAAHFAVHPTIKALGVNCTAPQYVVPLIREIRRGAPDKAVVVYPNSGEQYDAVRNRWHGTVTPLDCATAAGEWLAAGATLIGGCCRMGPAHIAAMTTAIRHHLRVGPQ